MKDKDLKITGVIMTKNEEITIGEIIDGVRPHVDEILIIDGHSQDRTREIALSKGARVELDNGKGKGDGIRVAIDKAKEDILVFIDADGSHDPNDIPKLTKPILDGEADMVIGSRGRGGSDELHGDIEKFLRMTGGGIICLAINYRWNVRLTDSQNGYRAIRKKVANDLGLRENITTIEQEMTMKCLKRGYIVSEVPTHEYARRYGKSNINLKRVWLRYIWALLKNLL